MSYVGTHSRQGDPARNMRGALRTRDVSFAQLSRGIIPKPYLKGKSMSAFGAMTRRVTGN